jgi:hypothetical protein
MTLRYSFAPFIVIFVVLLNGACSEQIGIAPKDTIEVKAVSDPKYHVGDLWEYETRRREEHSRFVVVRVENSPKIGTIVHIGVDNLIWKTCQGDAFSQHVPHMPFARQAIDESAIRRVASNSQRPDYKEGHEEWRQAFLEGHAGVYSIPVKYAVAVAEETWRTGMGCGHSGH